MPQKPLSQLTSIYEDRLDIPMYPVHQFLLCPVGLVGAGKTTVVKPLSRAFSLVRISWDEIRKVLKMNGTLYTQQDVKTIAVTLANKFLNKGYGITIDSDCSDKERLINILSRKYKLRVVWVHVNPPTAFIIDKLKRYNHTWLFKNSSEALKAFYERISLHEKLQMPFMYTFDTSKSNLALQIEEAQKIIETSLVNTKSI